MATPPFDWSTLLPGSEESQVSSIILRKLKTVKPDVLGTLTRKALNLRKKEPRLTLEMAADRVVADYRRTGAK